MTKKELLKKLAPFSDETEVFIDISLYQGDDLRTVHMTDPVEIEDVNGCAGWVYLVAQHNRWS